MNKLHIRNVAIGASTFVCAAFLSFSWSGSGGPALSIDSAQARVGRPLTPVSVAGVARRQYRRGNYGYGAGAVGAGLAGAAVVGTAAAAAATGWPYNNGYYGRGGTLAANAYYTGPVETSPFYLQRAYYGNGPWYGYNGWADYKARYGIVCDPGTTFKGSDGLMHVCQ
ncbi:MULTISPECIES: hypothetical protein [unclassified Bradyrhizobium]|uniref:hypothetical protein n=1 Tax=unclassified Bradyrhizobium TaxID=2631580 RepID=UPI0023051689|nr:MULTISPECIES: hypothetical protein [unclassified Bradyrhizobium]MDA9411936.1 hypothetical protein [Bradyrhizobium sp. CCBAU 45384]MDA9439793.1 hypothetical protein [Bradyrhizobium sp. CCBAU 51745]